MKKLLSFILAIVLTVTLFTSCAEPAEALTSIYLNLGEKYLTDLNYEEAIVYFNKVIEVEPKNARAYLGSAEAYVAMGDIESAIAILEQGIEVVDDPTELQAMLAELLGENEAEDDLPEDEVIQEEQEEEEIPEITAEDIGAAINEASLFAWNWFWDNQHTDKTDTIIGPYGNGYYTYERVSEEGITTVDDVLALTQQYFTADIAEYIVGYKEWIEQDGVLYVSATEGLGGPGDPNYYEIYAEKTSDTSYNITLYECYSEDDKYQRNFTYSYVDGYWIFDTILYCPQEIPVYVLTEPLDEETEEEIESESDSVPFHVQAYMQDTVNWSWNSVGAFTSGVLGDTLTINWTYDRNSFDGYLTVQNTSNWTMNPIFAISVGDCAYLQLPEEAEIGDTGDSAVYTFTYSDITITATGYEDVVISGGTAEKRFTVKQENGYTSGTSVAIDLLSEILEQTGISLYQFANEYLPNLTNISFEITFVDWKP
ncbi:MAG: tetratricopeptide repeat protein [Oscillospiraceae bacterium]|nr:tetratricopeptide repeat protein [Oscillospiraceae bacterium]